jgi:hypothetical protein
MEINIKRILTPSAGLFISFLVLFLYPQRVLQEEQLKVSLRRDWGFAAGGKIQGTFSLRVSGPNDLTSVTFFIDDQILGEVNDPPFSLRFVTDNYDQGMHTLHAIGTTTNGNEISSNVIEVEFVSAGEGWQSAMNIIIPIGVVVLIAIGVSVLVPLVFTRGKKVELPPGAPRNYGYFGGAICPKCSRPFSRHIYGLNLGTHKLDRCPYCGKWSLVRRASREDLAAAEAAELETAQDGTYESGLSDEEILRKELDDSRFEDL